ncbi:MAG: abortive infection family protein [Candidatus Moraniibacteriota bacterium]
MKKLKEAIAGKNRWDGLESFIFLVEQNRETNPNVALDGAKSVVENISKTILTDKGIVCDQSWSVQKVVKTAFESLPVFKKITESELQSAKSVIGSFENIIRVIGEFRNSHGFFAHGRDIQSEKFDQYLVELVISSSDLISSFLVICHAEDLKDRSRIYYEENDEFNRYIDESCEEGVVVRGIQLSPSRALYSDIEAYKEELLSFINEKTDLIERLEKSENFVSTRSICSELIPLQNFFTEVELKRVIRAGIDNPQIYRILGHGYTRNLFTWILEEKEEILTSQEIVGLKTAFAKKLF